MRKATAIEIQSQDIHEVALRLGDFGNIRTSKEWVVIPLIVSLGVNPFYPDSILHGEPKGYNLSIMTGETCLYFWYHYKRDADTVADQIRLAIDEYHNGGEG